MARANENSITFTNDSSADKVTVMSHGPLDVILTTDPVDVDDEIKRCHDHYEFFFPINTIQRVTVEDKHIDCHPGQIVPMNPGQPHSFSGGNKAVAFIVFRYDTGYMTELMRSMSPEYSDPQSQLAFEPNAYPISPGLQSLSARIIREFDERKPGRDRLLLSLAEVLGILLIRTCYSRRSTALENRQSMHSERYLRFRQEIEYMQTHIDQKITIDDLAEIAGMNRYHFIRTFKSAFLQSPYDYLTDLRIEQASKLLKEDELPASEIASLCGFFSASRFSAAFKLATGLTPTQFRNIHRTEAAGQKEFSKAGIRSKKVLFQSNNKLS